MYNRTFTKTKKQENVKVGSILIAQPFWQDERYQRSVILILDHDREGSTGIILNKQSNFCIHDALPELEIGLPLYYGGPFNVETILYVHNNQSLPESIHLGNELFCEGNYEYLQEMIRNKQMNLRKIKFYSGTVRWNEGQLEAEIAERKWWTSELTAQDFFASEAEELWPHELLNNGHVYGLLNNYPDPGMN